VSEEVGKQMKCRFGGYLTVLGSFYHVILLSEDYEFHD